ncbi:MAG TPA: YceI family protein [Cyclobacteriaceae bacterium]|nr:YceI family protein [Cyclobacteriaceae bacterium]
MKINILLIFLLSFFGQIDYRLSNESSFLIKGTSTLHDWEMESSSATGNISFDMDGSQIVGVKALSITIPAESLKSDKSGLDKNAYKSLKSSEFKNIIFKMSRMTKFQKSNNGYQITCDGSLEIAGKSNKTSITATCSQLSDGSVKCKGEKPLKMSEYGVEPPSFMFGSVKTGDEIAVEFDVNFNK